MRVLVGPGRQGRHLGDHAVGRDHAVARIGDVGGVVIEGGKRADHADHHRHRVGVATQPLDELVHLLVHHRVVGDVVLELPLLLGGRQVAVEQEVAALHEVGVLGQLLDRIAAVEQHALVAVDVGDRQLAAAGRGVAGVEGEVAGVLVQLADVDDVGTGRALQNRQLVPLTGGVVDQRYGVVRGVNGRRRLTHQKRSLRS